MFLTEMLKKPFLKRNDSVEKRVKTLTSVPSPDDIDLSLNDKEDALIGFFDGQSFNSFGLSMDKIGELDQCLVDQKDLIEQYRRISEHPEVNLAISEIVNEATFAEGDEDTLYLQFEGEVSKKIKDVMEKEFNTLLDTLNIKRNLYTLFERFYIDGQLNIHCSYKNNNIKEGIQSLNILSPIFFFFNSDKNIWMYRKIEGRINYFLNRVNPFYDPKILGYSQTFSPEEVIHIDSGLYKNNTILSDLHPALKVANMLQTLEEMLIPMRFSRSVSRRVFNLDVANMSAKKAEEYLKKIQEKFKYKKFYDVSSGTISNQQHIASLTEDYWFLNRSGSKGTSVETIDETGNLGETGDLDYFKKKLFLALKVPVGRLNIDEKSEFDFTATSVTREEVKFFSFITRKRNQFTQIFIDILKRQLIAKGIMLESEFDIIRKNLKVCWQSDNKFFEKMKDDERTNAITLYRDFEELAVKGWISKKYIYQEILKFSEEEMEDMQKQIELEKKDKIYRNIKIGDDMGDNDFYDKNYPEDQDKKDDKDDRDEDTKDDIEQEEDKDDIEQEEDRENLEKVQKAKQTPQDVNQK